MHQQLENQTFLKKLRIICYLEECGSDARLFKFWSLEPWLHELYVLFIKRAGVLCQRIKTRREAECFRC